MFVVDFVVVCCGTVEAGVDPDCKPRPCCCALPVAGGVGGTGVGFVDRWQLVVV